MQRSAQKQLMVALLKVRNREVAEENSGLYYKEFKSVKLYGVRHTWDPRLREVEAGGLQIPSHPGLPRLDSVSKATN